MHKYLHKGNRTKTIKGKKRSAIDSYLIWLKSSQPAFHIFGAWGWSLVGKVIVPDNTETTVGVFPGIIQVGGYLVHFYSHWVVAATILARLLQGWDVWILYFKSGSCLPLLGSFGLLGVLLVLFSYLCYLSVYLTVHLVLLVNSSIDRPALNRIANLVIWWYSASWLESLILVVNFTSI